MIDLINGIKHYFLLPLILSLVLVPICKWIGFKLNIYAVENNRTVHSGKIVRMGGVAVFLAFMLSTAFLLKTTDNKITGMLVGGVFVFMGGLLDDIYDLKPLMKLGFQIVGAIIAIEFGQIYLTQISLPFNLIINNLIICKLISFVWIIGVCNAINLIDGLDGLSGGISFIVTCTIGLLAYFLFRRDVQILTLILSGAILGFLPYNFHPASIFMGDCGALFLGYLIAVMSLMGFKTAAFVTLGLPVLILFIPIGDTLIAMLRRKLSGKKISEADRSHLHHILMYKLEFGHRNTVLILYAVSMLFGLCAIVNFFNPTIGTVMIIILLLFAGIFIELTGMINHNFHPLLSIYRKIFTRK